MPINPMIPLAAGQGVPQVKSLSDVMTDVARIKTAEAQVRRLDAISVQEAEQARQLQERRARMAKADGIAKLYANDEGQLPRRFREAGLLPESVEIGNALAEQRRGLAQQVAAQLAMERATATVTASKFDTVDDEASYNFVVNDIATTEKQALKPGQRGLADEFKGMTYEQAVATGTLDRLKKWTRAQAGASGEQINAFEKFAKDMENAGLAHAVVGTTSDQRSLDVVNKLFDALHVPAEIRNSIPRVWTEGLAEEHKRIAEALRGANTTAQGEPLERVEVPENGRTVIKLIPRSQAAGTYEKPTPVEPVVLTERPSREEGDKIIPGLGTTPNSIFQNGVWFAVTAKMPPLGMGNQGGIAQTRQSIQNTGNALIAKSGLDAQTIRSAYQANQKSMDRMVPLYNQTTAFANSALASLDFAVDSGSKVWNAKIPTANRMRNWLSGTLAPNEALSEFEVFVYTAARDYAKVTSGGALSIAELSVAAAQKADQLLNSAQSPGQFKAAANAMRRDMGNVMDTQRDQIGGVSKVMANFLQSINPAPVSARDFSERVTAGPPPPPPKDAAGTSKTGKSFVGTFPGGEEGFDTQAQLDEFVKQAAAQGVTVTAKKTATSTTIPVNPKVGDTWMSPTGLVTFQGKGKGWK